MFGVVGGEAFHGVFEDGEKVGIENEIKGGVDFADGGNGGIGFGFLEGIEGKEGSVGMVFHGEDREHALVVDFLLEGGELHDTVLFCSCQESSCSFCEGES